MMQFRYHYNEETIKVDLTGNARIIKVGSRDVNISPLQISICMSAHTSEL